MHCLSSSSLYEKCFQALNLRATYLGPSHSSIIMVFQRGDYTGCLVYNRAQKIQAYLLQDSEGLIPADTLSPFPSLRFKNAVSFKLFQAAFSSNYHVRIAQVGKSDFKVYLLARILGGNLSDREKQELEQAKKLSVASQIFFYQKMFTQAHEGFQKCLQVQQGIIPNSLEVAQTHHKLGLNYMAENEFERALEHYKKSLVIRERLIPNTLELALTCNSVALAYKSQGDLKKALEHYHQSFEIQNQLGSASLEIASLYVSIGTICYEEKRFEQALELFKKCVVIHDELKLCSLEVVVSHYSMGKINHSQGRLNEAMKCYHDGANLYPIVDIGNLEDAKACFSLAETYQDLKIMEDARSQYQEGFKICNQVDHSYQIFFKIYSSIGEIYSIKNNFLKALEYYQKSLDLYRAEYSLRIEQADCHYKMGLIYKKQCKLSKALVALQASYDLQQRNHSSGNSKLLILGDMLAQIAWQQSNYKAALDYIDKVLKNDPSYQPAYTTKGFILSRQGRLEEAHAMFAQAEELSQATSCISKDAPQVSVLKFKEEKKKAPMFDLSAHLSSDLSYPVLKSIKEDSSKNLKRKYARSALRSDSLPPLHPNTALNNSSIEQLKAYSVKKHKGQQSAADFKTL